MRIFQLEAERSTSIQVAVRSTAMALALCVLSGQASAQITYGGRCFAACLRQVLPLPSEQCFADSGNLPGSGGNLSASEASVQIGLDVYAAANLAASALAGGGSTDCSSTQEQVSAFGGLLVAASVRADAQADCAGATGSSTITGLALAGANIAVTGAANQTVTIPGVCTLVINEQELGEGGTSIAVNALRLTLVTGEELVLCSAFAETVCAVSAEENSLGSVKSRFE